MEKEIIVRLHQGFEESVQKEQETGLEFWLARDLQKLLDYDEWRNFSKVIDKAKTACLNSGQTISDHFVDTNKMVELGSGSQRRSFEAVIEKQRPPVNIQDMISGTIFLISGEWLTLALMQNAKL